MIDYKYKDLYKQESVDKQLNIEYDGKSIQNTDIYYESMELVESLCSDSELRFGACEASQFKIRIANVYEPLIGKVLNVSEVLNGNSDAPFIFGSYKVNSDKPTGNRRYRDIVAYDAMHDIVNADVAEWYNTILPNTDSTVTLKAFRDSFFAHFGIEQESVTLANDSMTVEKTVDVESLSGGAVASAICEINGAFGRITRDGKFRYVFLKEMSEGLYPSDTLYPRDDLYPRNEPTDTQKFNRSNYISCEYEDFTTSNIARVQIRQEENDIGKTHPENATGNLYVVQDNFLVYGKSSDELEEIASNLFEVIKVVSYRPTSVAALGNPCLEVGDGIRVATKHAMVYTYILQRTLKGIQALRDTYESEGVKEYSEKVNGTSYDIQQLKGKSNVLSRSIEETRLQITDVENGLKSEIVQTASSLKVEISQAESNAKAHADSAASIAETNAKIDTDNRLKSYSTTEQMNSAIQISADNINASVSQKITETKEYADDVAGNAESNAKADTVERLKSYSTTTEMNSAIKVSADSINSNVSKQIAETKSYADDVASTSESNAKADTANKLKSYSTTTQMNSAIEQSADSINLSVSQKITETKEYADDVANTAETNSNAYTNQRLSSYSTTTQMNSAIEVSINEIRAEVTERTSLYNAEINTIQGGMEDNLSLSFFVYEEGAEVTTQANKNCIYPGTGEDAYQNNCSLYQDVNLPSGTYLLSYEWLRTLGLAIYADVILLNQTTGEEIYSENIGYAWPQTDTWNKETFQFVLSQTSRIRFLFKFEAPSADLTRINSAYLTNIAIYGTAQSVADAIGDVKKDLMSQSDLLTEEIERATSVEVDLNSKIEQTASTIRSEVSANYELKSNASRMYTSLSSSIEQTASSISSKVSKNAVISEINQTAETVTIKASKIDLEGLVEADELVAKFASVENLNAAVAKINTIESNYVTANYVSSNYATIANLNSTNANVSNLSASVASLNTVVANKIDASTVKADYMEVANWTSGGYIQARRIKADDITAIIANTNVLNTGAINAQSLVSNTLNISNGVSLLGHNASWQTKTIAGIKINYLGY